jgi:hypothetical protein
MYVRNINSELLTPQYVKNKLDISLIYIFSFKTIFKILLIFNNKTYKQKPGLAMSTIWAH